MHWIMPPYGIPLELPELPLHAAAKNRREAIAAPAIVPRIGRFVECMLGGSVLSRRSVAPRSTSSIGSTTRERLSNMEQTSEGSPAKWHASMATLERSLDTMAEFTPSPSRGHLLGMTAQILGIKSRSTSAHGACERPDERLSERRGP
uniref:Uncharacterized protein n=1 Tax=mine drainage metagenome TaxID=410659 RepID=E6PHK4_9ZZZZ